jgi:hypothetical protein
MWSSEQEPPGKEAKMFDAFRKAVLQARKQKHLYFAALLDEKLILECFGPTRSLWQGWIYTPAVTVWVFLSQCLSADHSCRDAVARLVSWRVAQGRKLCSADTSAYCTARDALPESACRELVRQTGRSLENETPSAWRWHGRPVWVVDGSTVTMPDTPENQAEYPQVKGQKRGCGFPIARILVVFSLATGAALDAVIGKYHGKRTGENSMFRMLHDLLAPGDVVLADRYFSGWCDLALLVQRGVDVVVRKHQFRLTDFRTGRRLGRDDHVVRWRKVSRPEWMSPEQYATLPGELTLREMRVWVKQRGFRTKCLLIVTTLLDAEEFSAEEIAELYRRRWQAELYLRSLKTELQMDHLRCKKPHRVRNEIAMHLVGYNIIRHTMALAAQEREVPPWQVSFKGALQTLNHFLPLLVLSMAPGDGCTALLASIGTHKVGKRPDRYEPRRVKRRPKQYKLLQEPRNNYRKRMA